MMVSWKACAVGLLMLLTRHHVVCLATADPSLSLPVGFSKVISTKSNGLETIFSLQQGPADEFPEASKSRSVSSSHSTSASIVQKIQAGFRSTFLPLNYPDATPPGYLSYAIWSWIQDLSTQLRGVLATQRVLQGVGVGVEGATALSALMNFIVRDGCGMAANLLFTSVASSNFAKDPKRWRLFADIMVDVGITLEVAATLVPSVLFLPMICVGTMCKAICGVAAGAVSGLFNLYWAQGSDISDISAKFGAQHTITGSLGLVFAALFAKSVSVLPERSLWTLYTSLTLLHVYANMQCMRLISFDWLNTTRIKMIVKHFFASYEPSSSESIVSFPEPPVVAKREPLFFLPNRDAARKIRLGVSFDAHIDGAHTQQELVAILQTEHYLISTCRKRGQILVSFSNAATPRLKAKAYLHAVLLQQDPSTATTLLPKVWPMFESSCKEYGWDLDKTELSEMGYELSLQ